MSILPEENTEIGIGEKRERLEKLSVLIKSIGNGTFESINALVDNNEEAKDKLVSIINFFWIYYHDGCNAFMENEIFNILYLYYKLLRSFYQDSGRGQIDRGQQQNLINNLNAIPQQSLNRLNLSILEDFRFRVVSFNQGITRYEERASKISDDLKNQAKPWKLSSFSGSFKEIADEEGKIKVLWMMLTLVFGVFATLFVLESSLIIIANEFNISLVEYLQKLSNTFLLYFISYWCSRRYYICRTQEIIYRHIAAILNVYDIFKDTSDEDEKHIVITEMAHTIFSSPVLPNMKTVENSDWAKILDIVKIATAKVSRNG